MTYRKLADLRAELAARCHFSKAQSGDSALTGIFTSFLQSAHELLYWEFDWAERQVWHDAPLASGAYLADYPSVFSKDQRVLNVAVNLGYTDPGAWVQSTNYALGDVRRPTVMNGLQYEVTADAGSSDTTEPAWPTAIGATVVDSGVTWTCRAYNFVNWQPVTQGIELRHYNTLDVPSYPTRYQLKDQIELTPRANHGYVLRLFGVKDADPFYEDDHSTSINDRLVFLFALANAKAHYKHPDAATVADQFKQMFNTIKSKKGWKRSVFSHRPAAPLLDDPYDGHVPLVKV